MNIQKENDKYLVSLVANCGATQDEINDLNFDDETSFFESNRLADWFISQINFGWKVWQAAKAQAIPDGFVVVPKEPTKEMIHIGESTHYGYDNIDSKHCYIAMIEAAQDPAND
ncbi:hypothetical protein [Acinetobacter sp. YH12066]|uniref:hypothetical protein n=1 Tax=Acinetobacter sp. YH12066 TaxID=2601063 RepID=UPI0015D1AF90|nr:hypothetical protein [Acinetobacter sp. YH12066]